MRTGQQLASCIAGVRRDIRTDRGSTLVDVVIASMIMSVAIIGLVGSLGTGMSLVGHSRQRTSGLEVAQERLENVHAIPYEQVGLTAMPVQSADPASPDYNVTSDGRYCPPSGGCESLVTGGTVLHIEDPCSPPKCAATFSVDQYVT